MPGVDLIRPENHAVFSVGGETPDVWVVCLTDARTPGLLQRRTPAGAKYFVQIRADADIHILRHQCQTAVPGGIKPPRFHLFPGHIRPKLMQNIRRPVLGAGVQHDDPIGL